MAIRPFPPTHPFAGSDPGRQSVGDPGHCEPCAVYGHAAVHPELGCRDVGCYRPHGDSEPADETGRQALARDRQLRSVRAALDEALAGTGLPFYERNGTVTLVVAAEERVAVAFPGAAPSGAALEVRWRGGQAEFTGSLPAPTALAGLVLGLVSAALDRETALAAV
jgi:hypothetical protein